jgi:hypothetical protein
VTAIFASRARTKAVLIAVFVCAAVAPGCYTLVPSESSRLVPGREVALELNDLGRVNLSSRIGAEVRQLAGTLVQPADTVYTIRTRQITFLNGRTAEWSGEQVLVKQEFVRGVFEQKISSARTTAAVAGAVAVLGGVIAGMGLTGGGNDGGGKGGPPPPPVGIRVNP